MRTFAQLLFSGLALGAIYALIALGFTVIYRASRVINFAQGQLLALGAFTTSWLVSSGKLPFWAAFVIGALGTAAVALVFQSGVLRFALGRPDFTIVMLTLGLATVLNSAIPTAFGDFPRTNGDPWGASAAHIYGVALPWVKIWTIVAALVVLVGFFAFNRYSKYGLAMRGAALDPEAALAVGIPLRRVYATAWVLAGVVACVGGVFLAGYPNTLDPTVSNVAFLAFPAIILGGIDSTTGAVLGGFVIGVVEELTAGYQPQYASWLGHNFYLVAPYVVMIAVLLVRPYGLFGTRPAERL
ncbi:MAG TPA: branched-chain amino acid ABC transporter permease [Acidimicrobiales bacterium]|nr:branched-chain amino acid ABC transporter permease [Acidimicrobiales bacterium]